MNLEIGLKMTGVPFDKAQLRMDTIKTKIDELQSGALNYIKYDRTGLIHNGDINFGVLLTGLDVPESITKLTSLKNKIEGTGIEILDYKLL